MMKDDSSWMDISVPLRNGMVHYPGDPEVRISRTQDIAKGDAVNVTSLSLGAHSGTHIDAPLHFLNNGISIDRMPIDAVNGLARVISITDEVSIKVAELEANAIAQGEILLFKTRNSALWHHRRFQENYVYLSTAAVAYLIYKGIRAVGIDYLSVGGFNKNEKEAHDTLLRASIWIIESLDLSSVEAGTYELLCLPLRLDGAEAAPARAILRPISPRPSSHQG
jgi:arylformamidase